jgi:class 3 adenylate cyclase
VPSAPALVATLTGQRNTSAVRRDLPTGTVTFLFTDVEGSTKLVHELGPQKYAEVLAEHRLVAFCECHEAGASPRRESARDR